MILFYMSKLDLNIMNSSWLFVLAYYTVVIKQFSRQAESQLSLGVLTYKLWPLANHVRPGWRLQFPADCRVILIVSGWVPRVWLSIYGSMTLHVHICLHLLYVLRLFFLFFLHIMLFWYQSCVHGCVGGTLHATSSLAFYIKNKGITLHWMT